MARWYPIRSEVICGPVLEAERKAEALRLATARYGPGVTVQSVADYECAQEEAAARRRSRTLEEE